MCFVHQLVMIFSSHQIWDIFPYVRPCRNSQYQIWKTIFEVGFSWGFNFVNIWNLSENTHKIFKNLVQTNLVWSHFHPFVCWTSNFTCIQSLYSVFGRHPVPVMKEGCIWHQKKFSNKTFECFWYIFGWKHMKNLPKKLS